MNALTALVSPRGRDYDKPSLCRSQERPQAASESAPEHDVIRVRHAADPLRRDGQTSFAVVPFGRTRIHAPMPSFSEVENFTAPDTHPGEAVFDETFQAVRSYAFMRHELLRTSRVGAKTLQDLESPRPGTENEIIDIFVDRHGTNRIAPEACPERVGAVYYGAPMRNLEQDRRYRHAQPSANAWLMVNPELASGHVSDSGELLGCGPETLYAGTAAALMRERDLALASKRAGAPHVRTAQARAEQAERIRREVMLPITVALGELPKDASDIPEAPIFFGGGVNACVRCSIADESTRPMAKHHMIALSYAISVNDVMAAHLQELSARFQREIHDDVFTDALRSRTRETASAHVARNAELCMLERNLVTLRADLRHRITRTVDTAAMFPKDAWMMKPDETPKEMLERIKPEIRSAVEDMHASHRSFMEEHIGKLLATERCVRSLYGRTTAEVQPPMPWFGAEDEETATAYGRDVDITELNDVARRVALLYEQQIKS